MTKRTKILTWIPYDHEVGLPQERPHQQELYEPFIPRTVLTEVEKIVFPLLEIQMQTPG
jgi:hypothetical protein